MARTVLPWCLVKHFKEEEKAVLDTNNDELLRMHQKVKITADDLLHEFTPKEHRMLAERTKVKVDMRKWNYVWDCKQQFDKEKRLENRSESYVNRMFVKAYNRRMYPLYTDQEIDKFKAIAASELKKDNIVRVQIWNRQNLKEVQNSAEPPTAEASAVEPPTAEPPAAEAPTAEPSAAEPPTAEPPADDSFDWGEIDEAIDSEDLTIQTINLSPEEEIDVESIASQAELSL